MSPELRKLLDGTEAAPGFALLTFPGIEGPVVLASTRLAAAMADAPPRTLAVAVRSHLEKFMQEYEGELGQRKFLKGDLGGVEVAFIWHIVSCLDGDVAVIVAALLSEQLDAERALIEMERHFDRVRRLCLGGRS